MPDSLLSLDDINRFEKLRIDRLRSELPSLTGAIAWITLDYRLVIACLNAAQVDALMIDVDQIETAAWLILGVRAVSIVFAGEQIWASVGDSVSLDLLLESIVFGEIESMSTATLEQPQAMQAAETSELQYTQEPQVLRTIEDLSDELAAITGGKPEEMRQTMLNLNPPTFSYNGQYLISPSWGDAAIDAWATQIKQRLRSGPRSSNVQANGKGEGAIADLPAQTAAKKTAAKKPAAKKPAAAKRTPGKQAGEGAGT